VVITLVGVPVRGRREGPGCGRVTPGAPNARAADTMTGVAASCVGLTAAQQFAAARIVFDGVMLSGPTVGSGRRRVLSSPARVRVVRYLKGSGPGLVRVQTALRRVPNGVVSNP
jgi:hypothetical protein